MKSLIRCNVFANFNTIANVKCETKTQTNILTIKTIVTAILIKDGLVLFVLVYSLVHIVFIVQSPNCSSRFCILSFSRCISVSSRVAYLRENVCDIWVFLRPDSRPMYFHYRHEFSEYSHLLSIYSRQTLNGLYSFHSKFMKQYEMKWNGMNGNTFKSKMFRENGWINLVGKQMKSVPPFFLFWIFCLFIHFSIKCVWQRHSLKWIKN